MAEHGTVEYATAAGNDYPAHENTYERFLHFTFTGIFSVIIFCSAWPPVASPITGSGRWRSSSWRPSASSPVCSAAAAPRATSPSPSAR